MSTLPTGTVTFLFTDIEGSTRLAQEFPAELSGALTRHHTIVRQAIEQHEGVVFQIVGDAFCAAFARAALALEAARAAQQALQAEAWGALRIQVRMGLHTGDVEVKNGQYEGYLTLSYTQRLMALAAGGQVLMSATTEALVHSQLPQGVTLRDLGAVQPKDFPVAEHLYQMCAPGLRTDFPPLAVLVAIANNLPLQLTSLIGREPDIAAVRGLLQHARMVTLTGAGGTGKTRLLIAVAESYCRVVPVERLYQDGVWFVELAPLSDAALLPQTVARALGVREQPGRLLRETLGEHLRGQQVLLCLDNCEHLLDACAQLADGLLRAAPRLVILASSRETLGLAGESAYRVPSLELPGGSGQPSAGSGQQLADSMGTTELLKYAAIRLFVERATQVNTSFRLTEANARAVVQICTRLDGIPLAIELAAARIRALSAEQIATRLDDRFRLLNAGTRTGLAHHQTLGALIDWSYNLLSEPERVLLRRLSVFAGGWTLEAAEAVCTDDDGPRLGGAVQQQQTEDGRRGTVALSNQSTIPDKHAMLETQHLPTAIVRLPSEDVLELLSHLVEKSLVMVEMGQDETRYWLLETIRQYARDRLRQAGELERWRACHAHTYRLFAEEAEPALRGAEQAFWWQRVGIERDNLRAAIDWSLHGGRVADAAGIVSALWQFWAVYGYFSEADALLHDLLARPELAAPSRLRALLLNTAGTVHARMPNAPVTTPPLFEEALRIGRALNDAWNIGVATAFLSQSAMSLSEFDKAVSLAEESVALWRAAREPWFVGMALVSLGDALQANGETPRAEAAYRESAAALRSIDEIILRAYPLRRLGYLAMQRGAHAEAAALFGESLRLNAGIDERLGCANCLAAFAELALAQGRPERAARLFGAMQATLDAISAAPPPQDQIDIERNLTVLRAQLDGAAFDAAWSDGRALTLEQAVALALEDVQG